jgi:hypothetical protein
MLFKVWDAEMSNPQDEMTLQDETTPEEEDAPQAGGDFGFARAETAPNTEYVALQKAEDGRPYDMWPGKLVQPPATMLGLSTNALQTRTQASSLPQLVLYSPLATN